jgi:metal-sulfur cluster biosynthetic enzyme
MSVDEALPSENGQEEERIDPEQLKEAILWRLKMVIDPETGVDVVRMRLIEDLKVDPDGTVHYKFRPSSPVCPIAVPLVVEIRQAVSEVKGVKKQDILVVGYVQEKKLNQLLREGKI